MILWGGGRGDLYYFFKPHLIQSAPEISAITRFRYLPENCRNIPEDRTKLIKINISPSVIGQATIKGDPSDSKLVSMPEYGVPVDEVFSREK